VSTVKDLKHGLINRDRRALSKAITLIESSRPEDRHDALVLLDAIMPHTGKADRVAISGSPGVGKSTFIECYGEALIKAGKRVAALTIDPSSRLSGGSILGDKTRMPILANHPSAFIRPTPAGSILGGVARRSREVMALCEAAGFDTILVETVGVGQSETEAAMMTDCYLLLLQPGSGDALQGIKRGIIEMADIVIVNKADGNLLSAARESAGHYKRALAFIKNKMSEWSCPVILCSSIEKTGLQEVSDTVSSYLKLARENGHFIHQRDAQMIRWLEDETIASLVDFFKHNKAIQRRYKSASKQLDDGHSPARIASNFVTKLMNHNDRKT
jgi:LAO/AO transport system kinase